MRLWRIVATATVVEAAVCAAAFSVAGIGGAFSGWFDLLNNLAPVWFALAILTAPAAALLLQPGRARRMILALTFVAVAVSGAEILPELAAAIPPFGHPKPSLRPLRIVTFNTWTDNPDPAQVVDRIRSADPDAAALIEMSWRLRHSELKALDGAYPYRAFAKPGCPPDMILISKRPFSTYGCQITISSKYPGTAATIVWGRTTAPDGRPFLMATTHYAWPFPHGGQSMQRAALARFVRIHPEDDMILTGDFNLTPWTFALRAQDRMLRPLTRRDHAVFTWPAMIARLNKPAPFAFLPIDHIYAGSAWRTARIARLSRAGSDHYGIEAVFER